MEDNRPVYIHYFKYRDDYYIFDPKKFNPVTNRDGWNKPNGGYWACREDTDDFMEFDNGWAEGSWNKSNPHRFKLKGYAKVLYLQKREDVLKLPKYESCARLFPFLGHEPVDFEKLATMYDAIEIIDFRCVGFDLYGWDFRSILITNPEVIETI